MTAPKRYFLRHLLWAFPTRFVRVWWETERFPAEVVRLVNEAFVGGMAPRRRLCRMPRWRPPLRRLEVGTGNHPDGEMYPWTGR